jgi:hypothetical protein
LPLHTHLEESVLGAELALQAVQDPEPAAANWPVEQGVQLELVPGWAPLPIVEYVPAAHGWHAVVWAAMLYLPASQAVQPAALAVPLPVTVPA